MDIPFIQRALDRRRPGQSAIVTQRKESDTLQIISGVFEGKSTGMPIAMLIPNEDQRGRDYAHLETTLRPSHADYAWRSRFGTHDFRGGGRSSARETAARVAAGAVAQLLLRTQGVFVQAWVSQVGHLELKTPYTELDLALTDQNEVRCPDPDTAEKMIRLIRKVRKAGDTVGGVISALALGVPAGWGEPVFDKLHADLGKAMLSINAAKGFEYGAGFSAARMTGSQHNDLFIPGDPTQLRTATNHSGGIQGGISNGMDIYCRTAFKPVATLLRDQDSVNLAGEKTVVKGKGRHDPCVAPRAVPIVEAMMALVLADHYLRTKTARVE